MTARFGFTKNNDVFQLHDTQGIAWQAYLELNKMVFLVEFGEEALEELREFTPRKINFCTDEALARKKNLTAFATTLRDDSEGEHYANRNRHDEWEVLAIKDSGELGASSLEDLFIQTHIIDGYQQSLSPVLEGYYQYLVDLTQNFRMQSKENA